MLVDVHVGINTNYLEIGRIVTLNYNFSHSVFG